MASSETSKISAPSDKEKAIDNGDAAILDDASNMKRPSLLRRAWTALGFDMRTIIIMAKGALPPIIALSAYESDSWAEQYSTLGYLAAVMSILGMGIMPRAKFVQTMTLNVLFVCVGTGVALLEILCVVKARQSTTPANNASGTVKGASGSTQSVAYNSSASAVAALWLMLTIYSANVLQAKRPQLKFPAIIYCIFTIVASTYAPQFPKMKAGQSFAKRLIETFLTGFGIAAGVSLFIFPMTSRTIASKQMGGFLGLLKVALTAHGKYMRSVSSSHGKANSEHGLATEANRNAPRVKEEMDLREHRHKKAKENDAPSGSSAEAAAMKNALREVGALFGKIHIELGFAKKEMAYGKLGPEDFRDISLLLRDIMLPVVGMTTFIDILQSIKNKGSSEKLLLDSEGTIRAIEKLETEEWDEIMALSDVPFQKLNTAMQGGLTHISYILELAKRPKTAVMDPEKPSDHSEPGDKGFATFLEAEIESYEAHREKTLRSWCERKGIELPIAFGDSSMEYYSLKKGPTSETLRQKENQQQLYLVLFVEYLTWSIGQSVLEMVRYSDRKAVDGTMTNKRLILPGWKRLSKWIRKVLDPDDTDATDDGQLGGANVWIGDSLRARKDPEHLPPTTFVQKSTNYLRAIPRFFSSPESSYGARTAVATMSLGILAFLRQTSNFFIRQRLLWALIMCAIAFGSHAGQGIYGFVCRIAGTVIAGCAAIVIWYMADGKPAAVLPVLYVYMFCAFYIFVKKPQYVVVAVLSIVTSVLIVGYELQVSKIGLAQAESNGQPYYPIYVLAPYRLATVVGGLFVACFWTYVPYPVTTHGTLRRDLGATLYLLGNYYSCVHTTVQMRLQDGLNYDETKRNSPMAKLAKARMRVFAKIVMLLSQLRESSNLTRFEPTFGGKFPRQTYDDLIARLQNLFNLLTLISYSTKTFTHQTTDSESDWLRNFRHFASDLNITSQEITSMLCLVSSSITNSQPLPPYLKPPKPFDLAESMRAVDPDILSINHVSEPCYAAFAVLQVASSLITDEMELIVKHVKDLVGEVDFSFHVISTSDDSSSSGETVMLLGKDSDSRKGKRE